MNNLGRRLGKVEKQLHIEKPHIINIAGMEIMPDELDKLLKEINGKSRGLPIQDRIREYESSYKICAGCFQTNGSSD